MAGSPDARVARSNEAGWYQNLKSFFKAPLLDPSVEDDQLAEWIDSNTMRCHKNLLPLLAKARPGCQHLCQAQWADAYCAGGQVKRNDTVQVTGSTDGDTPEWVLDDGSYGLTLTLTKVVPP